MIHKKSTKVIIPSNKLGEAEQHFIKHYQKCATRFGGFELITCKPSTHPSRELKLAAEAKMIQELTPKSAFCIALDEKGKTFNTKALADKLSLETNLCFWIGSSDGLCPDMIKRANLHLSLSALTMTHQLALAVISEQIYRILSIANQHPYHRD